MDALSIACAGLTAAAARYAASAAAIASGTGDLATNLTELSLAKVAVEASAAVARTSSDLSEQLVNVLVQYGCLGGYPSLINWRTRSVSRCLATSFGLAPNGEYAARCDR